MLVFPTLEQAAAVLADLISEQAAQALLDRGLFTLALSGGSSGQVLGQHLFGRPLDWSRVHVFQVDERFGFESDDERLNQVHLQRLMSGTPAAKAALTTIPFEGEPLAAATSYEARLPAVFDAIILGMGADGHIASLFPSSPIVPAPHGRVVITEGPYETPIRIGLSMEEIATSRWIGLLAGGEDKRAAWNNANLPVGDIRRRRPDLVASVDTALAGEPA